MTSHAPFVVPLLLLCPALGICQSPDGSLQSKIIRGQVTDELDNPLAGYVISAVSPTSDVTFADRTNQAGKFSLVNLHAGTWLLQVRYDSTLIIQRGITVSRSFSEIDTYFTIKGNGTLSGFLIETHSQLPAQIDGDIHIARLEANSETYSSLYSGDVSNGCFEVRNLLPGRYVIIDAFKGYIFNQPDSPILTIYPDSHVGGVELLLKQGALLHGNFVDAKNGASISGVNVQVASEKSDSVYPNWEFMHETETDTDGTFWLTTPNDAHEYYRFSIIALHPRYQAQRFRFDLSPHNSTYDLGDIALKRMLSLEGNVSGPKGGYVEGLVVRLKMHTTSANFFRPAAETELTTQTDSQGKFVFHQLYPIEYTLTISRNDVIVAYVETVHPESRNRISVRLPQLKRLHGKVVDGQQMPIAAAEISATRYSEAPSAHSALLTKAETEADGTFEMQVLETQAQLLSVDIGKSGYFSTVYENVEIAAVPLLVTLEKGVTLTGQLILPMNVPLDGYYGVKIFPADAQIRTTLNPLTLQKPLLSKWFPVTQSNFTIESLFAEKYQLYIVGPGIAASGIEVDTETDRENIFIVADVPTQTLQGQVRDASTGEPVRNALVLRSWYPWELEPYDMSMTLDRFETETDEEGQFIFPDLTWGPYQLRILSVKRVFDKASGTYRQTHAQKQIDFIYPKELNPYCIYLGRQDGRTFK